MFMPEVGTALLVLRDRGVSPDKPLNLSEAESLYSILALLRATLSDDPDEQAIHHDLMSVSYRVQKLYEKLMNARAEATVRVAAEAGFAITVDEKLMREES